MTPEAINEKRRRTHNKQSALAIGVLFLSLAALQSPLWHMQAAVPLTVPAGGAELISSDRPVAQVMVESNAQATAEVVGDRQVLIRGKALGETELRIMSKDGRSRTYRVVVQAESAKSPWDSLTAR